MQIMFNFSLQDGIVVETETLSFSKNLKEIKASKQRLVNRWKLKPVFQLIDLKLQDIKATYIKKQQLYKEGKPISGLKQLQAIQY